MLLKELPEIISKLRWWKTNLYKGCQYCITFNSNDLCSYVTHIHHFIFYGEYNERYNVVVWNSNSRAKTLGYITSLFANLIFKC